MNKMQSSGITIEDLQAENVALKEKEYKLTQKLLDWKKKQDQDDKIRMASRKKSLQYINEYKPQTKEERKNWIKRDIGTCRRRIDFRNHDLTEFFKFLLK